MKGGKPTSNSNATRARDGTIYWPNSNKFHYSHAQEIQKGRKFHDGILFSNRCLCSHLCSSSLIRSVKPQKEFLINASH